MTEGAGLLDRVHEFLGRFVAYPSDHAHVAHTLWIAHTHLMGAWESTPRLAFLSPEPGSGKSRALEVTELLVPRPVLAVNTTPAYLFRKVSDKAGPPTILYDEIDTVFGPKAKDNEDIRGMLNAGHRRGATAGRCVVRGKEVFTEELPAYCAVALAGLGDLPDTILTRSVIVRMRRRGPAEKVEPFRLRLHAETGRALHDQLRDWAASVTATLDSWPAMPEGIEDRAADVWEPLLAVSDAAGGDWPELARDAAKALVRDSQQTTPSLGIRLLADLRQVYGRTDAMSTEAILDALHHLEEAPWSEIGGKPLNARGLASRVGKYGVRSVNVNISGTVVKGYRREHLWDVWTRYLPPIATLPGSTSATSATSVPSETETAGQDLFSQVAAEVADSTQVADQNATSPQNAIPSATSRTPADLGKHTTGSAGSGSSGSMGGQAPAHARCVLCHHLLPPGSTDELCPACDAMPRCTLCGTPTRSANGHCPDCILAHDVLPVDVA